MVQPAVVRQRGRGDKGEGRREGETDPPFGVLYPPLPTESSSKEQSKPELTSPPSTSAPEPVYTVKYRGEVAMEDFTNDRVSPVVKRPKEIVVTVQLPGLTSVGSVELDVTEKQLLLDNKHPPYHLDLALSYPVDGNSGKAEFDKRKCLIVTLPVLPSPPPHTITKSHDLPNHESSNQVAELGSRDTETQESTNEVAEPESHDLESQVTDNESHTSANEVAELESRDLESGELTNQIAVSEHLTQPETVTTSSADSTNHSVEPSHVTWTSKGKWVAPSFTYRQDDERVAFVLHSPGTKPSTLVHH
ncbi:Protein kintoun, partial [Geodia barretti]